MGYWVGTLIFAIIQAIVTLGINYYGQPGNKGLLHIMGITAVVQCWMIWGIVYIAQMNPLIHPQFKD